MAILKPKSFKISFKERQVVSLKPYRLVDQDAGVIAGDMVFEAHYSEYDMTPQDRRLPTAVGNGDLCRPA